MTNQSTFEFAQAAIAQGISVIPILSDGSKQPAISLGWKKYRTELATLQDLKFWFLEKGYFIALVCDEDLECLDFDSRDAYAEFSERANVECKDLFDKIKNGYESKSPRGTHLFYKVIGKSKTQKLARSEDNKVKIETRGNGSYIIEAPSKGYELLSGGIDKIVILSDDEHQEILELCKKFDCVVDKPNFHQIADRAFSSFEEKDRPGDFFMKAVSWNEILEPQGWTELFKTREGVTHWQRPNKSKRGTSATTGHGESDGLYVFTSSTSFNPCSSYTKFGAYAHLHFNDDFKACARSLASEGFRKPDVEFDVSGFLKEEKNKKSNLSDVDFDEAEKESQQTKANPWIAKKIEDEDRDWLEEHPPPRKFLFTRSGKGAIPRGCVGMLWAPGGRGKTMALIQMAVSAAIGRAWLSTYDCTSGNRVLLVLGEETKEEIWRRLYFSCDGLGLSKYEIGLLKKNISTIALAGESTALVQSIGGVVATTNAHAFLLEQVRRNDYDLIIIDPFARFAPDCESSNALATGAVQALEALANTAHKPFVLLAHHTSKQNIRDGNKAQDSSGARGATALVDGCRWVAGIGGKSDSDIEFAITKSNYAATGSAIKLYRNRDSNGVLEIVTDEMQAAIDADERTKALLKQDERDEEIRSRIKNEMISNLKKFGDINATEFKELITGTAAIKRQAFRELVEEQKVFVTKIGRTKMVSLEQKAEGKIGEERK